MTTPTNRWGIWWRGPHTDGKYLGPEGWLNVEFTGTPLLFDTPEAASFVCAEKRKDPRYQSISPMGTNLEVKLFEMKLEPGLYRHYKGGLYTVQHLVTHHDTRLPMVVYVSHQYGGTCVRPLLGWGSFDEGEATQEIDQDGWFNQVYDVDRAKWIPRFVFVGELPSDTRITEWVKAQESRAK